jgi:hypothetical protein
MVFLLIRFHGLRESTRFTRGYITSPLPGRIPRWCVAASRRSFSPWASPPTSTFGGEGMVFC